MLFRSWHTRPRDEERCRSRVRVGDRHSPRCVFQDHPRTLCPAGQGLGSRGSTRGTRTAGICCSPTKATRRFSCRPTTANWPTENVSDSLTRIAGSMATSPPGVRHQRRLAPEARPCFRALGRWTRTLQFRGRGVPSSVGLRSRGAPFTALTKAVPGRQD